MEPEMIIRASFEIVEPLFLRLAEKRILEAGGAVAEAGFGVSPDAFATYHMSVEVDPDSLENVQDVLVTEFPIQSMLVDGELVALGREAGTIATKFGDVRINDRIWRGRVIGVSPNLLDCASHAKRFNVSGTIIWHEAHRLAESRIGLKQ